MMRNSTGPSFEKVVEDDWHVVLKGDRPFHVTLATICTSDKRASELTSCY